MGSDDLTVEHSKLLGELKGEVKSFHQRLNNLDGFMIELRKMGEGMVEMNGNVRLLAQEIKTITETLVKHEDAIENIQKQMETKEGMARLYKTVEDMEELQEEIMDRLRNEENKEARQALEAMNKIKWWFIGGLGAIALSMFTMYMGLK